MNLSKDYYSILGISEGANEEEIKKAFREKSKEYHPDTTTDELKKKELEERFKEVNEAYQVISDVQERAGYDYGRRGGRGSGTPFNSFGSGGGGFSFSMNDIFAQIHGMRGQQAGGSAFHFSTEAQVSQEVEISLLDALSRKEIELPTQFGTIKFVLPAEGFRSGQVFTLRVSNDRGGGNVGVVMIKLRVSIIIPAVISGERLEKLKELLG